MERRTPNDECFQALGDQLRRELLCLMDTKQTDVFDVDQLSAALGALYENSEESIAIALEHSHLPKLRAAGLVEYDDRSGVVRYENRDIVAVLRENDLIECKTCCGERIPPAIEQSERTD